MSDIKTLENTLIERAEKQLHSEIVAQVDSLEKFMSHKCRINLQWLRIDGREHPDVSRLLCDAMFDAMRKSFVEGYINDFVSSMAAVEFSRKNESEGSAETTSLLEAAKELMRAADECDNHEQYLKLEANLRREIARAEGRLA